MAEANLLVRITGSGKELINEFDKIGKAAKDNGEKTSSGWAKAGKGIAAAGAGIAGVALGIAGASIEMADKFENSHARLVGAIKDTGGNLSALTGPINAVDQQMEHFGFTSSDTQDALAPLVRASGSANKALGLMGLAANVAAGRNISLSAATGILSKVVTGHVSLLGRLGIQTKDATGKTISQAEALKRLSAMYSGQAATSADTFGGKQREMKAELEDAGTKIGMVLIPILDKLAVFLTNKVIPGFQALIGWVEKNWPKLMAAIMPVIDKIKGYITGFVDTVEVLWQVFGGRIMSFATETWDHVKSVFSGALDIIQGVFRFFADLFTGKWGKLWGDVETILSGAWKIIQASLGQAWDVIKSLVSVAWDGIKQAVVAGVSHVLNFMAELPGKILGAIGDIGSKMFQIGVAIVEGIINGLGDIGKTILHKVTDGLGGLVKGVKSFLGIASPSRVFYDIGSQTMQGFVLGIGDQQKFAVAAAKTTLSQVISTIQGGQSAIRSAMDAVSAGGRTVAGGRLDITDARRSLAQAKNDVPLAQFAVQDAQAQLAADKAAGASAETLQKDQIALADAQLNLSSGTEAVKRAELALADARATEKSNVQALATAHGALASKMTALKDIFAFLSKEGIVHSATLRAENGGIVATAAARGHGTVIHMNFNGTNIGTTKEFQDAILRALRQAGSTKNQSANYGQQVQFT